MDVCVVEKESECGCVCGREGESVRMCVCEREGSHSSLQ